MIWRQIARGVALIAAAISWSGPDRGDMRPPEGGMRTREQQVLHSADVFLEWLLREE